jgi:hypothetical protein
METILANRKGYLFGEIVGEDHPTYTFTRAADKAIFWPTRLAAEQRLDWLNRGVTIESSLRGRYTITDFQVEEATPDRFVIFANAPFIDFEPVAPTEAVA